MSKPLIAAWTAIYESLYQQSKFLPIARFSALTQPQFRDKLEEIDATEEAFNEITDFCINKMQEIGKI